MENKNKMNELKVQKETKEESCDDEKSLNINILNQIKSFGTIISADSADLKELRKYCINDATTNPSNNIFSRIIYIIYKNSNI